jgi:hypothetical protein
LKNSRKMGKRKIKKSDSENAQPGISKFFPKAGPSNSKSSKTSSVDTVSQYCLSLNNNENLEKPEETEIETENSVPEAATTPAAPTAPATSSG